MDYGKLFGKRIQELRKGKKIKQHKLASDVGIEAKYLSLIETGKQQPAFAKIVAIAEALEVPMKSLFSFDDETMDEKAVKKALRQMLTKATSEQRRLTHRFIKMLFEN